MPRNRWKVPCSGPCRRLFRPYTVQMEPAVAHFLNSAAARHEQGLQWLCPDCRPEQPPTGPEAYLPPELWQNVFGYLQPDQLLRVRLTCHRWKQLVDGCAHLRKRFYLCLPEGISVNHWYQPKNPFPAAAQVIFIDSKITSLGDWWPPIGSVLTVLALRNCKIRYSALMEMLRHTPNMTTLAMIGTEYDTDYEFEAVDFRLGRVQILRCDDVLSVFAQIFPRLIEFSLTTRGEDYFDEEATCELLQSTQRTLQELSCRFTPYVLERIAGMEQLRLITVKSSGREPESVVELCQLQPQIENLTVTATNETLHKIGRHLAQLKKLDVQIEGCKPCVPTFLAEMPHLVELELKTKKHQRLEIEVCNSPNLEKLRLCTVTVEGWSLQTYLATSPKLQEVRLSDCFARYWSDLFEIDSPSLRRLWLWNFQVLYDSASVPTWQRRRTLTELELCRCEIPTELLIQLLLQCPALETLSCLLVRTLTNEVVRTLGQLVHLRSVTISGSDALTDDCVPLVVEHCSHVRTLSIYGNRNVSGEAEDRLRSISWSLRCGRPIEV